MVTKAQAAAVAGEIAISPESGPEPDPVDQGGNVIERLARVMGEVQSISKDSRNSAQNFNFRGIDAVMNVVGPALRKHHLVVSPIHVQVDSSTVTTAKGAPMNRVIVRVLYQFRAPDGTTFETGSAGEAFDSGDKATPKAMSVSFRTMLLQAMCIPTDEPDPDSESYVIGAAETVSRAVQAAAQTAPSAEALAESVAKGLALLKTIASEGDDAERIRKVAEWKSQAGAMGLLDQVTVLQSGEKITLAALADKVATNALVRATEEADTADHGGGL